MKIIFRKIGSRIIPIRISSVKLATGSNFYKERKVTASILEKGKRIFAGSAITQHGVRKKVATLKDVKVDPVFQRYGIGTALFEHVKELFGRAGTRFLRSDGIIHPAQVKIRSKYKTKFLGKGYGSYGEKSRLVGLNEAFDIVKPMKKADDYRILQASTRLSKKWRRGK